MEVARKRPLVDIENNIDEERCPLTMPLGHLTFKVTTPIRANPYTKKPHTNDDDDDVDVTAKVTTPMSPDPYISTKSKKSLRKGDNDEVLEVPPPSSRPTRNDANIEPENDATNNDDEDCVVEWSNASNVLVDFPHGRPDCGVHSFSKASNRSQHCDKCYCVVCDILAKECPEWEVHCQKTKKLRPAAHAEEEDDSEDEGQETDVSEYEDDNAGGGQDEGEDTDVIDVDQIYPRNRISAASRSYNTRRAFLTRRTNETNVSAKACGDKGDGWGGHESSDREGSKYDHHYSNDFNHAYNNHGGWKERERTPKDMRITEVLAQKLQESLLLSEGTASLLPSTTDGGDPGFDSRCEGRKRRFDRCKMEGDIPQLGLHKSFFVEGVRIGWPYPSILTPQRLMAIHLIKALKTSSHVVLESPTGTGKSAAILCAVLAWQRHHAKSIWGKTNGPSTSIKAGTSPEEALDLLLEDRQEIFPRIIYCSRTHSQVAQMVASLKKTPYRPRMTVLGSRDRLCIHKNIRNKTPRNPDSSQGESKAKASVNVNTACQFRVSNTEKMRKALWKSYDFQYDDNKPPEIFPSDGNGNGHESQDDEGEDDAPEDRAYSSEWIFKKSTKKLTCPHYRQLTSARTAQMTRSNFLVNQNTIDCCKSGGEKTKLGVHDIEDLVSFGMNPYLEKSVALYRRSREESFGMDVGSDCKIQAIRDDTPAKFNGQLRIGDKILAVNGKKVTSLNALQKAISESTMDMIELKVLRGASPNATNIPKYPGDPDQNYSRFMQIDVSLWRPAGQTSFGMTLQPEGFASTGCSVNGVKPGSAAKSAGVKEGDVIVSVKGDNVQSLSYDSIFAMIQATEGDPLTLTLERRNSAGQPCRHKEVETESDESEIDHDNLYSPHSACPYYLSRALSKHAELLFAPYNYILDPGIRAALGISLNGSVVVLDEGHNVEGALTKSGSGKFGELELSSLVAMLSLTATAVRTHKSVVQINGDDKDLSEIAHELLLFVEKLVLHMRQAKSSFEKSTANIGAWKAIADYLKFHTPDNTEFEVSYSGPNGHGVKGKAVGCQPFFDAMKISANEVAQLLEYAAAMQSHLKGESWDGTGSSSGDGANEKGANSTFDLLHNLLSKFGLATQTPEHFYISLVIQANGNLGHAAGEESSKGRRFKKKPNYMPFIHPRSATNPTATLPVCNHKKCMQAFSGDPLVPSYLGIRHGYWCDGTSIPAWEAHLKIQLLFPGLLMKELASKCRTIVLASGSISPLQSFCSELNLHATDASKPGRLQTKPAPLEASHVINLPKQLLTCAVGTFPDGSTLTVNYNNYKHPEFFPRLGTAIASIVESIPSGGCLIFLPSYSLLNKCVKCWDPSTSRGGFGGFNGFDNSSPEIWERLIRSKGKVIVEPTGNQEAFEAARDEYAETIKTHGSCILLAVFRGKMSEGISFNDDNARGVICVGIPFPNAKDRAIVAKKSYNDEQRNLKQRTDLLPGADWYAQEAYRALAQALGRCIRHEGDYGVIVLLDSRHGHDGSPGFVHSNLPKWMRNSVRTLFNGNQGRGQHPIVQGYQGLKREMEQFFAQASVYTESVLLQRKKELTGGLATLRHNEIRQELGAIALEIITPSAVTVEPPLSNTQTAILPPGLLVHSDPPETTPQDPPTNSTTSPLPNNDTAERGDPAIRNLFECGTTAINDVRITNLDSLTNRTREPLNVLKSQESSKRAKYQAICEARRESFHPFVASADGMLATGATKILQLLANKLSEKQRLLYSTIMKHLRLQISITLVRAVHQCIRASRNKRLRVPPRFVLPETSDLSPEFRMLFTRLTKSLRFLLLQT